VDLRAGFDAVTKTKSLPCSCRESNRILKLATAVSFQSFPVHHKQICHSQRAVKITQFIQIVLGYGLEDRGSRIRFPAGAGNYALHHRVQNGSGSHPTSHPMGTGGSFSGVKRPGSEADHSPPSSAEVKNAWSYTSTPPICLHGVVLS
jgi:hypothetical protein